MRPALLMPCLTECGLSFIAQHGSAVMTNVLLQLDVWYRLGLVCFTLQGTLLLVQYQPCMPVSTN